jgi:2-C-methyl-D-erythritol 2,4-cyclodiphosphate synthase
MYFVISISIVDSILGALSLPDIGQLFPDNDPNWKGADSSIFMEEVTEFFERTVTSMYNAVESAPMISI